MATQLAQATEESDRAAMRNSVLYKFSQRINRSLHLPELINTVGEQIQAALQTERCAIWLQNNGQLVNSYAVGYDKPLLDHAYLIESGGLVAEAYSQLKPWLVPSPAADLNVDSWVDPKLAMLALPLIASNERMGVIIVQADADQLGSEQLALAQSFAAQTALALENAHLYDQIMWLNKDLEDRIHQRTSELRDERDRLELLYGIANAVSTSLDSDTMFQQTLQVLAQRLGVTHGSILRLDPETRQLVRRKSLGTDTDEMTHFPLGIGIAGWVASHGEAALIHDVKKDKRWVKPIDTSGNHKQRGALIVVPLLINDEVIGVLQLSHPETHFFTHEHLRLLTTIANEVAIAIHNADLYYMIREQAAKLGVIVARERAAASQSQAILQSIADGVLVCDLEGQMLAANPASARMLDLPLEDLFLSNLHELLRNLKISSADRAPLRELLQQPFDANGDPRTFRTTLRLGTTSVNMALAPVIGEGGEVLGGVSILRDITREIESDRLKDRVYRHRLARAAHAHDLDQRLRPANDDELAGRPQRDAARGAGHRPQQHRAHDRDHQRPAGHHQNRVGQRRPGGRAGAGAGGGERRGQHPAL